jgi:vitamin B12/bleomycin/antimicrobial peptide transport system ATP-binding/permease protein
LFVPLALGGVALAILGVSGRMTAQRKWRERLSCHLTKHWLGNDRYRHLALQADDTQNLEYRIAEDARVATDAPIDFAVGLLTSLLTARTRPVMAALRAGSRS